MSRESSHVWFVGFQVPLFFLMDRLSFKLHVNVLTLSINLQVKKLVGDIDDMLQWTNDLRTELKSGTPFGALPDTAKEQFEKFQVRGVKNKGPGMWGIGGDGSGHYMLQRTKGLRTKLKSWILFAALPDTAKEQFEKFKVNGVHLSKLSELLQS